MTRHPFTAADLEILRRWDTPTICNGASHAHIHMVQMRCDVAVFGMLAHHDDVIHADFHGAVVIPAEAVKRLPEAIDLVSRREKVILDMARAPGFTSARMRDALKRA